MLFDMQLANSRAGVSSVTVARPNQLDWITCYTDVVLSYVHLVQWYEVWG